MCTSAKLRAQFSLSTGFLHKSSQRNQVYDDSASGLVVGGTFYCLVLMRMAGTALLYGLTATLCWSILLGNSKQPTI